MAVDGEWSMMDSMLFWEVQSLWPLHPFCPTKPLTNALEEKSANFP